MKAADTFVTIADEGFGEEAEDLGHVQPVIHLQSGSITRGWYDAKQPEKNISGIAGGVMGTTWRNGGLVNNVSQINATTTRALVNLSVIASRCQSYSFVKIGS